MGAAGSRKLASWLRRLVEKTTRGGATCHRMAGARIGAVDGGGGLNGNGTD